VIGFVVASSTTQAFSADWRFYFENRPGVRFFIGSASVVHLKNGNVRAWQKQEWKAPAPDLGGETGFLWLLEMNCSERKYIYREISPIKGTGKSLELAATMWRVYGGYWDFIQPNDLDEATYAAWCTQGHAAAR
jgi:hypothetical protein